MMPSFDHRAPRPLSRTLQMAGAVPAAVCLLLLAACGDGSGRATDASGQPSAGASKIKVSESLSDNPCSLLPKQAVADAFSVPADAINEIAVSSTCNYSWKDKAARQMLEIDVNVARVGKNATETREYFDRATHSMTGAEVQAAMGKIREQAEKMRDPAVQGPAADALIGEDGAIAQGGGISFEDVSGLGDRARFQPSAGRIHVLYGNLYFEVAAYHGAQMTIPDGAALGDLSALSQTWMQETQAERKQASEQLARTIIASL